METKIQIQISTTIYKFIRLVTQFGNTIEDQNRFTQINSAKSNYMIVF